MISRFILISFISLVSVSSFAFREVRNGGGGVQVDGRYLTFQSAKIPVTAPAEKALDIPGLQFLVNKINTLPVDETTKGNLILNIWATSSRKYYKVENSAVDPVERAAIIAEYSKLMKIPADNVALFAITSPEANATLLLPEFYQLTRAEQAAILLHESLWIWKPNSTYHEVVSVEQAAQAYFEKRTPTSFYDFVYNLGRVAKSPRFAVAAALGFDLAENKLGATAALKKRVPLKDLFGALFVKGLLTRVDRPLAKSKLPEFAASAIAEAANNSITFPNNVFYSAFLDFLQAGGFVALSAYVPLEETDLMAPREQLLGNKVFQSSAEISDYMYNLYIDLSAYTDLSLPSKMEPLRFRLVNPDGQVLGSIAFF